MPTVADVVGADVPWSVDGDSLLGGHRTGRAVGDWSRNEIEGVDGVATVDRDGTSPLFSRRSPAAGPLPTTPTPSWASARTALLSARRSTCRGRRGGTPRR